MLKFAYLKDLDDVDPFDMNVIDGGKESEQVNGGLEIKVVIALKYTFVVIGQPATASLALGKGAECNTIFSFPPLQKIKASILNENNDLIIGLLGEQFKMEMMVPQRAKEAPKTSEGLPVSLSFAIQETQNNTKYRGIRNITVELKNTEIQNCQTPGPY